MILVLGPSTRVGASTVAWKTGPSLRRALSARVDGPVTNGTFRDFLLRLSRTQRVAVMLDRRLDPSRRIRLNLPDRTLAELFEYLARDAGGAVTTIGPVVYIGPETTVVKLAAVARARRREAEKLPSVRRRAVLNVRAWQWSALAQPRVVLGRLAEEGGVAVEGIDRIPHDLWPAMDFPPMAWTDRMTLVLAGFDLTFSFADAGRSIRLLPLPDRIAPVAGAIETALRSVRSAPGRSPRTLKAADTLYTMKVRHSVGVVLNTIRERTGLKLEIDPNVGDRLKRHVEFEVQNVKLQRLLRETLTPAGLTYQRQGDTIRIRVR